MTISDLRDCTFFLLTRASLAVTARLKRALAEAELTSVRPSYLGVLMSLWAEDGQKVNELGRRVGLEPSTMTGLLDRMERDGLVARTPDPNDRRAQRIRLTGDGRRVQEAVERVVDSSLDGLLDEVSENDLETVKTVLRAVLARTDRGRG